MIQLLDTHQHLVYRAQAGYGWTDGIPPLAEGDFTLEDYAGLVASLGVKGSLFMETGVDDPDYQAETRFALGLAEKSDSGILGIIASIRPEEDEGFEAWLEECCAAGNVVGFRRVLHVVDNDMSTSGTFRSNIRKLGERGKVFDLCFTAGQLSIAADLAKSCDNTKLVLNHCGVPDIASGSMDTWKKDISNLAKLPHLVCKLSGLMAYCKPGESSLEAIQPYVDHVLEAFGPGRMVWGSDWPVVNLAKGLPEWISVTREILGQLSEVEAEQIASGTAEQTYGVKAS